MIHWDLQGASHGASRRALSEAVSHWVPGFPRPLGANLTVDILLVAGEVDGLDTALLDEGSSGLGGLGESGPGGSVDGGDEGPLLDSRRLDGLPQGAAESSAGGAGSHCWSV